MYIRVEIERGDETERGGHGERSRERERLWNQKVSKNDFANPKPRQNEKIEKARRGDWGERKICHRQRNRPCTHNR